MKTSLADVAAIQKALADARAGRATLGELGHAHDLASAAGAHHTLEEIRGHMRVMNPPPRLRAEVKSVGLGIVSGLLTHLVLGRGE